MSASARMHAEAQQGWFIFMGERRGNTIGRDERRRERTAVPRLSVALTKEQLREQAEAHYHYDTQNTKNKTFFQPTSTFHFITNTNTNTTNHVKATSACRNETVKPLPPARLLSKQGSRRRSGLVVFPVVKTSWFDLRPGRGTVSYEEQTVTDVTSVEVQTVVQACWSMLGSICLKSCDNVVACPIIGACVRNFLLNKAVYRKSSRIQDFLEQCLCWCDLHQVSPSGWIMCCLSGRKTCRKV